MGKKILSLCMVLVLCLCLLPVTALAAAPNRQVIYVGNENVTSGGYWTTDSAGTVTAFTGEGTPADKFIHYDADNNVLTLRNATIKKGLDYNPGITGGTYINSSAIGVFNEHGNAELTIKLEGTNTIAEVSNGIYVLTTSSSASNATLTIEGDGSLDASASQTGIWVQGNSCAAALKIENAKVTATLVDRFGTYGVFVQSAENSSASLTVDGGSLTATGKSEHGAGIQYTFGSSSSGSGKPSLNVSNSAIVKASGDTGGITSNSSPVTPSGTGIVFNNGTGTVYGSVTLQEDLTIGEDESLTIGKDASLTVPSGTTLTNNGTVTTTDGGSLTNQGTINNSGTLPDSIEGSQPPKITTTSLFNGEVDKNYSQALASDNNPTNWSITSGSLPGGLTLNESTGLISGTPTSEGTSNFTVTASNNSGSDSKELTLTINPAPVLVTSVALNKSELSLYTGQSEILTATVQPDDATNKNVTWQSDNANVATVQNGTVNAVGAGEATITVTTEDGEKTATCTVTVEKPYTPPPYIPPSKTPSQQAIDKIEDAKEGSTVKITLRTGQTKLDKEVFEELAGRDVTLEISLPGGVTWTVNGEDIPKTSDLTDLDMGVSPNTSTIPVDLINAITGEIGTVQLTLKHDGPFGFTMTLTAPVGKENEGLWANLYHYDEDAGEMVYQTAALVDEDGNAALPFDHASQYAIVLDSKSHELPFTDLGESQWYESAVAYVYRHNIMEGMSATTFQPNGTLSRAMAVQIFYNLEGQPDISDENLGYPYEDVDAQAWYGDAVYWARITGVATGYGDGTFQPGDSITRQEFAQMLYNYAKYKGYDLTAEGDLSQFPDSNTVADWAETAMSWANGNQLINGHDNGTIDAAGTATRAQAASILMRFDQNLVEK